MKSRLQLSSRVLRELSAQCSVDPTRDLQRMRDCVEHRGESFLTISLPDFCSAFERSLDQGYIAPSAFRGPFGPLGRGGVPAFLSGFLTLLFDDSGKLKASVDPDVVFCVRQFTLLHKKSLAVASEKRQRKAIRGYLSAEDEITETFDDPDGYFRKTAGFIISDLVRLAGFTSEGAAMAFDSLIGRHGPGATAEGYTSNSRWNFRSWHDRLERVFPYSKHAVSDESLMLEDEIQGRVNFVYEENELPVKVVFVPKTMKTPRVIAIEPSCMQYAQQAVLQAMVPAIESRCVYTKGRVNFTDQKINQRLALLSSKDRGLATLDMKEASDRVSYAHAKALFASCPSLWEVIDGSRSTRARLPDGSVVSLKKFASMGSALCFPVEALAFFVAIVSSRLRRRCIPVTRQNVLMYVRDVYVYGDDIIVPTDEAESVCFDLELIGFKVNSRKSFWAGKFRESCGVDAYDGVEVTPTYCRFAPPDRTDTEAVVSWVAMANGFYTMGLWQTAGYVRQHIEKLFGVIPVTPEDIGGLSWRTFSRVSSAGRWNSDLHCNKVRTWVPTSVKRTDEIISYAALHKCLQSMAVRARGGNPAIPDSSVDDEHLLTSVRRHALALKRGWVSVS